MPGERVIFVFAPVNVFNDFENLAPAVDMPDENTPF